MAATIPNESILINTLALQEAKDSSAVENIITTHDDLFRAELFTVVHKQKIGRSNYYVNQPLMKLFVEVGNSLPQTPVPLIRTITNQ